MKRAAKMTKRAEPYEILGAEDDGVDEEGRSPSSAAPRTPFES